MRHSSFTHAAIPFILCVSLALAPWTAHAVDGVVLIDQNKALAGGVTPGDAPGFPVTVGQPGSYRLVGNLVVPAGQNAFVITAPNVKLDLNGFTIFGNDPANLTVSAFRYTGRHPGAGLVIRNGSLDGFAVPLERGSADADVTLMDLSIFDSVASPTDSIIWFGLGSLVKNVSAPRHSLLGYCPSVIVDSQFFAHTLDTADRCARENLLPVR